MITINEAAARRMGMTVESVQAVLALSADMEDEEEMLLAQAQRVRPPVEPGQPPVLHTTLAIRQYGEMAESLGYSVRH